jgi:hypothetical protein
MMRRAEQYGLLLEWYSSLALLQERFRHIVCLVGFIAEGDELRSFSRRPIRPQVLLWRSAARSMTAFAAARIGWVER